jgi:hypothetical protein
MTYAPVRSCNTELRVGATDGTYKAFAMNRGGSQVEDDHLLKVRKQMSGLWHGFHEAQDRVTPDGRHFTSPYYQDVCPLDEENV